VTIDEKPLLIYLHFSDSSPSDEGELLLSDGKKASVIWKDVLVEGEYPLTPGANGPIKRKLTVIPEGESSREKNIVAMSDLIDAHEDGAFKYVTIPTNHRDGALDNTGYVPRPKGIRVVEKKIEGQDKKVMQAALGFTEPDVKGKVQRGTIPDCSAGIFFDWLNKHKNKRYRSAMKHVSLTPTPFMGNLDPFPAIFASDPDIEGDVQVQHFMFDDGTGEGSTEDTSSTKGDIVWNENASFEYVRNAINTQLNPKPPEVEADLPIQPRPSYYARDISREDTALVEEFFKGEQKKWIIPFTHNKDDGAVEIAPATRWVEAKEAMIAASDDFDSSAVEAVKGKLILKLSETFGAEAEKFGVSDLSLDHRVRIANKETGAEYVAGFTLLSDDSVIIEPTAYWERTKAPEQIVKSADNTVKLSDEPTFDLSTPRGRVEAARQHRRQRKTA
jgi:hypothetical protein